MDTTGKNFNDLLSHVVIAIDYHYYCRIIENQTEYLEEC